METDHTMFFSREVQFMGARTNVARAFSKIPGVFVTFMTFEPSAFITQMSSL